MKKSLFILVTLSLVLVSLAFSSAATQEINYSNPIKASISSPNFVLQTLKYDPYPVNAGQWFDVWVKVQNIGQDDAPNVQLELNPEYPFSSDGNLTQDFGKVPGRINAYKISTDYDASQIITKFRVKVADNAPEGLSNLKLTVKTDKDNLAASGFSYSLPISIAKTKSAFEVTMQDITPQGTSFVITNTGDNKAQAVTVTVSQQDGVAFIGPKTIVLGDLNQGDFTIAHVKALPEKGTKEMTIQISYTDSSGTRSTVEKAVSVDLPTNIDQICQDNTGSYVKWVYGVVGLFLGVILILVLIALDKKIVAK